METFETFEGTQLTLKAQGPARFLGAGFLGIWLCGWLVGEVVAVSFLFVIAWYLLTGEQLLHRTQLPQGPGLYAIGAFLLVWASFWTIGGIGAMRELARLLWGRELILLRPDSIRITLKAFPFSRCRELPLTEIRGFSRNSRKRGLMLELTKGRTELSLLGSEAEKAGLEALLRKRYASVFGAPKPQSGTHEAPDAEVSLPSGWTLESLPEGTRGLVRNQENRRKQVRGLWLFAMVLDLLCAFLVYKAVQNASYAPLALITAAIGLGCTYGAIRMSSGRPEWVVGRGLLRLQRRSGRGVSAVFEASRIELDSHAGEESVWHNLYALRSDAAERPPYKPGQRKDIAGSSKDASELRQLGRYLARQTGLPFIDRVDPGQKQEDLQALKQRLEQGGAFSRWISGLIKPPERKP